MSARLARLSAVSAIALAATAVLAGPASAADNTRSSLSWPTSDEIVAVCDDGAEIGLGFDLVRNVHTYTDRAGNTVRESRNVNYTGIFENFATGERYEFQGTRIITMDFVAGTFTSRGNYRTVTMPSAGIVLHTAGMYVEDLDVEGLFYREAGPRLDEWTEGGTEAVCSLFGS